MNITKSLARIFEHTSKYKTVNNVLGRNYAVKSELKIKWVRPQKVPCYKPEKSGDLESMQQVDTNQFQLEFRDSKELHDADHLVQKLFTLEFAPHKKHIQSYLKDITTSVQRHPLDKGSIESKIARWTGAIRAMQEIMEQHPRNRKLKVQLKELIDKRKKHLKYLRRWDYKKFEWLIDNLNLVYKPPPNEFHWITRKDSLRKLTDQYCKDTINDKLSSYKLILQEQQPAFLEEKIRSLEFIRNEQESCGVEITVTEEEINSVKQQLEDLHQQKHATHKED